MDARSGEETAQIPGAHEGAKSIKLCYLGAKEKMVSFGFTKQSQRQLKVGVVGGEGEKGRKEKKWEEKRKRKVEKREKCQLRAGAGTSCRRCRSQIGKEEESEKGGKS